MAADWKSIVKTVAPVLGTVLGGPMAGGAIKVIADKWLGNKDATEGDVATAVLGATPDQLLKLKEIEYDYAEKMRTLDIDVYKLEVSDRDSARQLFKTNYWPQMTISGLYILGYFGVLIMVMAGVVKVPDAQRDLMNTLLAMMGAAIPLIIQFWFGSTYGSREKTSMIYNSTPPNGGSGNGTASKK